MTDIKKLLGEATPLPWLVGVQVEKPFNTGRPLTDADEYPDTALINAEGKLVVSAYNSHCCSFPIDISATDADLALIVHAVNTLPDYEAAVDALAGLLLVLDDQNNATGLLPHVLSERIDARAALARLRGAA